ncbi:MAG: hypothetical protein AB1414_17445 [bacterium]
MKRALFSLYDTTNAARYAQDLVELGWTIIASKETVEILSKKQIPVTEIADFTSVKENYGFPPTLHPKVEYCLTAGDANERIDLVYVINYPLSIGNDIGGRTLLALAAKGNRIPVISIEDMEVVVNEIKQYGELSKSLHTNLLDKTNALISWHYFNLIKEKQKYDAVFGEHTYELMNGENPYQIPSSYFSSKTDDGLSLSSFNQVSGECPCFTNLADCDCIVHSLCLSSEAFRKQYGKTPYICIAAKHGNSCGFAIDWDSPAKALDKALFGNALAIWGGEVITNFEIDEELSNKMFKSSEREKLLGNAAWMLDIILAPHFTKEAIDILGKRKQRKVLENPFLSSPFLSPSLWSYRFVRGGFLRQPPLNYILNLKEAEFSGCRSTENDIDSLIIAWVTAFSSNHGGNEVAIAKDASLISCGGGPSTVDAAQIAVFKANNLKKDLKNSVFAADAFFPFTDAPELLINSGVRAGIVPAGGKEIENIKNFLKKNNVSMYYLPEQYRGFCRH